MEFLGILVFVHSVTQSRYFATRLEVQVKPASTHICPTIVLWTRTHACRMMVVSSRWMSLTSGI